MNSYTALLLSAASAVALLSQTPAAAQQSAPDEQEDQVQEVEAVMVTGSRISTYTAPTPVTTVSAETLERDAKVMLSESLRELPAFGASPGPRNSNNGNTVAGTPGLDLVNLRQLGINRTLVLFDGHRVVRSNINGGVDLTTMPSSIVQRVDVVTGGASAAWGSDAVAGVVNVILNRSFTGLQMNVEAGNSIYNDARTLKTEVSYGGGFAGGRGHVIGSLAYLYSPDTVWIGSRDWFRAGRLVNNPAYNGGANGQPRLIHADYVGMSSATQGGLITGCSTDGVTSVNCSLRGIQFVGPNADPAPFNFGHVSGIYSVGGSGEYAQAEVLEMTLPLRTLTTFGRASYELTDTITAALELNYGRSRSKSNSSIYNRFGNLPISIENPFLPESIRSQMEDLGYRYIMLGTNNMNNLPSDGKHLIDNSFDKQARSLGVPVAINRRELWRGVFSLEGSLGARWTWDAYYQHGRVRTETQVINNLEFSKYNLAVDAVRVTEANRGNSGLPLGAIACRSTLTDPTNGCQPLNVFGVGTASEAAIDYITGVARRGGNYGISTIKEDAAAIATQGTLPDEWSLGAGAIALAFGLEWRRESAVNTRDPVAAITGWNIGNFAAFQGKYHVKEAFGEITVPILSEQIVRSLELNAAGRITDYSTSGTVQTWKLGATSQVNDDLRLRTTYSLDIRAPILSELFATGYRTSGTHIDPRNGVSTFGFTQVGGNPNLKPERAKTFSAGVVYQPSWMPGLSASVDYYSIRVSDAISTVSATTVSAQCRAGNQLYCGQISYEGEFIIVRTEPLNADRNSVSGFDFQADYRGELFDGTLRLNMLGNYTIKQTRTALGLTFDYAGSLGSDSAIAGVPKFRTTFAATYDQGPWSGTVQIRYIGKAKLNNAWGPLDVDDNTVEPVGYLDLRGSYRLRDNVQLYGAIDNVLDTAPPEVYSSSPNFKPAGYRDDVYDAIGTQYRVGLRLRF